MLINDYNKTSSANKPNKNKNGTIATSVIKINTWLKTSVISFLS